MTWATAFVRSVRLQADDVRPANHLRQGYGGPPKRSAEGEAGRYAISVLIVVIAIAVVGSGCRQDMHDQPKFIPLRESTFFGDARSARALVPGTVARGQLHDDPLLETGKIGNAEATIFPFRVDEKVLTRGRERFDIFCAPCHGRTGAGDGMVVRRGYRRPASYHDDRLRNVPVGHFIDVMANGFGAMPDYADQVGARDRWAIAAYIRALQLSEHAALADVPERERGALR
jgi:mono/diheme cytochrome c family protein